MHYALAAWFEVVFKKQCTGECGLVIYADDFVATFQHEKDATHFLSAVSERFALFGLELEPAKTRLLEFGRNAQANRNARHQAKPETFDFLGFTHYCSKSRKGWFRVKRKTVRKKLCMKLKEMNLWLKQNRHLHLKALFTMVDLKLRGHYRYYGITDNSASIGQYYYSTLLMLHKCLNRRSQRNSYTWMGFLQLLKFLPLSQPPIYVGVYF